MKIFAKISLVIWFCFANGSAADFTAAHFGQGWGFVCTVMSFIAGGVLGYFLSAPVEERVSL